MDFVFTISAIVQSMAVSLGVGCSTVAIINFFVAISDGQIDENERKMMGIVYVLLRLSMVFILLSTTIIACLYFIAGTNYFMAFTMSYWTLLVVLYTNAILMTKRKMPSNIGPALQASTWYTLGILTALIPLELTAFSYFQFVIGYLSAIALAIAVVNGTMAYLKVRRRTSQRS